MTREAGSVIRSRLVGVGVGVLVVVIAGAVLFLALGQHGSSGPSGADYVAVQQMSLGVSPVAAGPDASTGSFTSACGRNEIGHLNADNFVAAPGVPGGAHHTHDYVGNVSTDANSTDRSLAAATTTCSNGDLSSYYWPVLRLLDGHTAHGLPMREVLHGNAGAIQRPDSVSVQYVGNPFSHVVPMPRFLQLGVGNPRALTHDDPAQARAQWGCRSVPNQATSHYPLCPDGEVTRTFEFPSCWNGVDTGGSGRHSHVRFPAPSGACPAGTFAIPKLRVVLAYRLPPGPGFAIDSFPDQHRDPTTDHGFAVNVMPDELMTKAVRCINEGRSC